MALPGAGTAGVIGGVLSKSKTPAIVAADELISSPEFTRAISEGIKGNAARADRIMENSPKFKRWLETATPQQAERIAALGFISWLASEEET